MEDAKTAETTVPQPGSGSDRLFRELLLAAVTGSALAPFVQAIATKLGEDVYDKIKDLLARRSREPAEHVPGEPLTLADPQRAIVIQLPASLTTTEAAGLANVRLPERTQTSWVYVQYDPRTRRWQATMIPQPPASAIEVIPPHGDTTTPWGQAHSITGAPMAQRACGHASANPRSRRYPALEPVYRCLSAGP